MTYSPALMEFGHAGVAAALSLRNRRLDKCGATRLACPVTRLESETGHTRGRLTDSGVGQSEVRLPTLTVLRYLAFSLDAPAVAGNGEHHHLRKTRLVARPRPHVAGDRPAVFA